jgi:hypothetical protein
MPTHTAEYLCGLVQLGAPEIAAQECLRLTAPPRGGDNVVNMYRKLGIGFKTMLRALATPATPDSVRYGGPARKTDQKCQ